MIIRNERGDITTETDSLKKKLTPLSISTARKEVELVIFETSYKKESQANMALLVNAAKHLKVYLQKN